MASQITNDVKPEASRIKFTAVKKANISESNIRLSRLLSNNTAINADEANAALEKALTKAAAERICKLLLQSFREYQSLKNI